MDIFLGRETHDPSSNIHLPLDACLRHIVCLGSSGSGKTVACKVLCEEFVLQNIPVIAIDPQGDIASLLLPGDEETLREKGVDLDAARSFHQGVEVIIWTPGSATGVPICVDPLQMKGLPKRHAERVRILSSMASNITSLLGYSLDSNDGQFASAYLDLILQYLDEHQIYIPNISNFADFLEDLPETLQAAAQRIIKPNKQDEISRKIQILGIGARRLLFQMGAPIQIDVLLGRASAVETAEDGAHSTRLSVVYLNTLHTQEEKEFFVSQLAQRLYDWMLNHPSKHPQALFYIDEIAPFLPPTRKPACKDILKMLFKQARKYGVSCLIASQNPGDIDYTALAQFSTWALGRMMIRQDIKKVEQVIRSLQPSELDHIVSRLPALEPGQFILLSPDVFDRAIDLRIRWLYTQHCTLDEERIEELLSDTLRAQFTDTSTAPPLNQPTHTSSDPGYRRSMPSLPSISTPRRANDTQPSGPYNSESTPSTYSKRISHSQQHTSGMALQTTEEEKSEGHKALILGYLETHPGAYTVNELTHELNLSKSSVRTHLNALCATQDIVREKVGSPYFYWLYGQHFEPSVGIKRPIQTLSMRIKPEEAHSIAQKKTTSKWSFGFGSFQFWRRQTLQGPQEKYLLLWKADIIFAPNAHSVVDAEGTREMTLYFHAQTAQIVLFREKQPVRFEHYTPDIAEPFFDPMKHFISEPHTPGELPLQPTDIQACKTPKYIRRTCETHYNVHVQQLTLIALPYWECTLRSSNTQQHTITLDGLFGKLFDIPV